MLWDVTPDEQVTFHDQKGWITSLLCLPDNRTVVSGSGDHSIASLGGRHGAARPETREVTWNGSCAWP